MTPANIMERPNRAASVRHKIHEAEARVNHPPKKIRSWAVVHACDYARDIADVVEAQVNAGMRPYLLTVGTEPPTKASILQTWQDVRRWKKAFDESNAHTTPELIHAHSFASGMAGVRMNACVVYDLRMPIEEQLAAAEDPPGSWLCRSLRTAEQFVMARAAAVVTHSPQRRDECIGRGISPQDVFVVPDPTILDAEFPDGSARLRETCSPERIAEMYDEVYRYAYSQRRKGDDALNGGGSLLPVAANL